jgi:Carboxypeptidase regulatory-like domain
MRLGVHPLWLLVVVAAAVASRPVAAQVGATTDILTGTVRGPDGEPLAGAVVEATSVETGVSRHRTSDAQGRYTIVFPDGGGQYELTARFIGMAPVHVSVARQADEDRIVADIRMGLRAVPLEPVTVSARSGAQSDRPGPGSTATHFNPEHLTRLPIDASDLNTVATLAPGVLGIAATDSTATAFSVAGQRPTANRVTLDGVSFGSGNVPQDAVRSIRIVTSTYDVARGQFSGGLVTSTTRGGTNVPRGSFTYAGRDRALAWGGATASAFGQGSTQNQVGGGMGGPIVPNKLFLFAALQGRWRGQGLPSLATADPSTLLRLGVSADSAARFIALAGATGAPVSVAGRPDDRAASEVLGLIRLDWHASEVHTVTLRLDGQWTSQEPTRVGSLTLPATGGTRTDRDGGVMASLTSYFGGHWINQLQGYVAQQHRDASALLALPAAHVDVVSELPGGQGVATLSFGGNNALPQHIDDRSLEITDEVSWLPGGATHRFKLGVFLNGTRVDENQTPNQVGTFVFPSLAALAANQPAIFRRTLAPLAHAGTAWNSALYAGDSWRVGASLHVAYGARLEATRFTGPPPYSHAVDSLFGLQTDRIPSEVHVSPRVGFTWKVAGGADAPRMTYLRGGIGDFRSQPPTSLYSAVLGAPGLSSAESELVCVGVEVPPPDWAGYARDPSTIPTQCASGTGSGIPHPNVTAFAPAFTAPRARRASLSLVERFRGRYWVTVEGSYARGVSQYGFRDLNLVAAPHFVLPDEASRPIFVPTDSIVLTTGAVPFTSSRLHPEFGRVLVIRSDLASDTKQLTFSFVGTTALGGAFRLAYTLTRARDQSSFSCCAVSHGFAAPTTGGDPNASEWATSDLERRHAFVGTVTFPLTPALELGAIGRASSGAPFTPLVGSDINGDGARNDRAFVFDPATVGDTAVANGMRALLAAAPSGVRRCLQSQLGRIATRNSCSGPWQPALDLQLNWRPGWFGFERRLTISVSTVNLLGGLDDWLHGTANLRGWGYATTPDPVLLYVRGFDPTTPRFLYAVNTRFGTTTSASGGIVVPFQVSVQGHLAIGPGRIPDRLRAKSSAGAVAMPAIPAHAALILPNPLTAILAFRDSLRLTPAQVSELQAVSDSLDVPRWPVGTRQEPMAPPEERQTRQRVLARARRVLTPQQWSKLPEALTAAAGTND